MLKLIVFDLDDTLFPEESYILSGFRAVAHWADKHLYIPFEQGYTQLYQLFQNGMRGHTFDAWLNLNGCDPGTVIQTLVDVYRDHEPKLVLYPEVSQTLSLLGQDFRLGLVSDGILEVQKKKWKALNLTELFSGVVFSDQWGREYWKPHCRPFREILRLCKSDGAEAVYIADNPQKDFFGAKQVGMYTIRVRRTQGIYTVYEPLSSEYAPHREITSLEQINDVIVQL